MQRHDWCVTEAELRPRQAYPDPTPSELMSQVGEWVVREMAGWQDGWVDGWMGGGMDGRMDGWMDGWVGG